MQNLKLEEDAFKKELEVVKEERRMRVEDHPQAKTFEKLIASLQHGTPYEHPVIGWPEDLETMSIDKVRAWHDRWYAPNNAVLVIAGDVTPQEIQPLVERYFGSIPAKDIGAVARIPPFLRSFLLPTVPR